MDRRLLCGALALGMFLAGCGDSGPLPPPTSSGSVGGSALVWKTYDRDAQYTGTTKLPTQYITLRDGVKLAADVVLPTDASGQAVSTPLPVILVQTGYNKNVGRYQAGLAGANAFLVERGYAQVIVDVRGTGNWEAFSQTEQQDYKEVLDWIVQ